METETYRESGDNLPNDFASKREGPVARAIEKQTSKLPSDLFLWAAGASIVGSLVAQVVGMAKTDNVRQQLPPARAPIATFIGMWAPTLLILGLYNKIVKVVGSDRITDRQLAD
jgi:hypothetical protein